MKLKRVLLRWYKSFHLNYRGTTEKGETSSYRPWNKLSPPFAPGEEFPFIEVPVEDDITTVVGANESGKSHLLNAISKVVRGTGLEGDDQYKRTDLCHYANVRTRNVEAWPNVGLQFTLTDTSEAETLADAAGVDLPKGPQGAPPTFTLILAPDDDDPRPARVFFQPNETSTSLDEKRLVAIRRLLPSVQYIDSQAQLPSEITITELLAAYGGESQGVGLRDRRAVEEAAKLLQSLTLPAAQQPVPQEYISQIEEIKKKLSAKVALPQGRNSLEVQLFREILGIRVDTLRYLYGLDTGDRGYVEGQIAKWNEEINNKLNLSHFWRQDEQFNLSVNYKDGVIYFEIRDKTESIYTFRERSSGLRYFLSYYIQAKAMEMSSRNRNSIILMDEPDSALSILGQRNLLSVFESLVSPESSGRTCQLIYTTHSPYLINRNFPRRIRVVKKEDAEEGTQYIEQARSRRYEPVRTALGIDSAPSLFLGADNVLVEGATDQYLLTELIRAFSTPENVGEFLDLNSVVFVSADGVSNVGSVLEQSRWADEPIPPTAIVVDSDAAADEVVDKITAQAGKKGPLITREFVGRIGDLVRHDVGAGPVVTTEDIVPRPIYTAAVKAYIKHWLPETWSKHADAVTTDLRDGEYGGDGLVESTKRLFSKYKPEFKADYDKMGVLQEVVSLVESQLASGEVGPEVDLLRKNLVVVCDFVREALEKSRAATAKVAATQSVKRIINDFGRLNKQDVPITVVQKLFRRLHNEVAPIGQDGEAFLKVVNSYLGQLEGLRSAGQERLTGEVWDSWQERIISMKRNPLTVSLVGSAGEGVD